MIVLVTLIGIGGLCVLVGKSLYDAIVQQEHKDPQVVHHDKPPIVPPTPVESVVSSATYRKPVLTLSWSNGMPGGYGSREFYLSRSTAPNKLNVAYTWSGDGPPSRFSDRTTYRIDRRSHKLERYDGKSDWMTTDKAVSNALQQHWAEIDASFPP